MDKQNLTGLPSSHQADSPDSGSLSTPHARRGRTPLVFYALIFIVLCMGFYPALTNDYVFHDDVLVWKYPPSDQFFHPHSLHNFNIFLGRYIGAFFLTVFNLAVSKVGDLSYIRIIVALIIVFCACFLSRILGRYFPRKIDAALIAIVIFTLPSFQMMVSWTGICFHALAVVFALMAIYRADKIPTDRPFKERIANPSGIYAILMMILAHMVYQSMATFYWAIAAALALFSPKEDWLAYRRKLVNIYWVGLLGIGIYFVIFKTIGKILPFSYVTVYHPQSLTHDFGGKLVWFVEYVFIQTLNLWNIFPQKNFFPALCVFLAGAWALKYVRAVPANDDAARKTFFLKTCLIVPVIGSFIGLSYLPNLMAQVNLNVYRCAAGLTALWIVLLVWGLKTYLCVFPKEVGRNILTAVLCFLSLWGAFQSYSNIAKFRVLPSRLEYVLFKDSIKSFQKPFSHLHIVRLKFDDFYHTHDEFGAVTTDWDSDVVPLLNCVFNEIALEGGMKWVDQTFDARTNEFIYVFKEPSFGAPKFYSLRFTISASYEVPSRPWPADALVINMRELLVPLEKAMGKNFYFHFPFSDGK